MSSQRRLRSYLVVLDVHQHEIDRLSAELMAIRSEQFDIQNRIDTLQHRRDTEGFVTSLEAAAFVADFLQAISAEQTVFYGRLAKLNEAAEELEEQVRSKFLELESWKVMCDRLSSEISAEAHKSEGAQFDEIARNIYAFKQSL